VEFLNYFFSQTTTYFCYDPKLGLKYNLDKDLRKNDEDDQLVKHKDTELYLLLYIPINYKK